MNFLKNYSENSHIRTYSRSNCAVFKKTKEEYGGLSNMSGGFPVKVNSISIRTSEALYQACRFPHLPEIQRLIIDEKSPMAAKMKGKPYRVDSRSDWDQVRVKIMRWCLRVKLACNWFDFGSLLHATGNKPIVEESRRDRFWGAVTDREGTLVGNNVLGRLLMELREELKSEDITNLEIVKQPKINDFLLFDEPISEIYADQEVKPTHFKPNQYDLF